MKVSELRQIIKEEINRVLSEKGEGNLHGTNESQREWVMKLASKYGGYLSASVIAYTLGITRLQLQKTGYAKRMYLDVQRSSDDFEKVRESVPFRSEAIYKLIGPVSHETSPEEFAKFTEVEKKLFKKTEGIFYPIYYVFQKQWALQGYLNITADDKDRIKSIFDILPPEDKKNCHLGDASSKEPTKANSRTPIVTLEEFPQFAKDKLITPVDESRKSFKKRI